MKSRIVLLSAVAAVAVMAIPRLAAADTCIAEIVSPDDGQSTTPTPTIQVKPSRSPSGCDPNWKEIEIRVTHLPSGNQVYEFKRDRGASRGFSRTSPPFEHTVPEGELREDERYRIAATLHTPTPFTFDEAAGASDVVEIRTSIPQYRTKRQEQQQGGEADLTVSLDASRATIGRSCVTIGKDLTDTPSVRVANAGSRRVTDAVSVGLYLSPNPTIDTSDTLLVGGREHVRDIGGGESREVDLHGTNTVPEELSPGSYYLGVLVDESDTVAEADETNNADAVAVELRPSCLPDDPRRPGAQQPDFSGAERQGIPERPSELGLPD